MTFTHEGRVPQTPSLAYPGVVGSGPVSTTERRRPLAVRLVLVAVFFVPVQIELAGAVESRFAPTDLFLAAAVLLAPALFRLRRGGVDMIPLLLVVVLSYGVLLSIIQTGGVNSHTLIVKFLGGFVLATLAIVAASVTRDGYGDQMVKWFLVGMAFWAVVAFIDWRVVDILPFVDAKTDTRFGAMQFDPNNAGAGYGVATIVAWKLGWRVFDGRAGRWACTIVILAALGLTLSRGGYISTAVAAGLLFVVERPSAQRLVKAGAVLVLIAAVAVASGLVGTAIDDFTNRPDNVGDREELANRGLADFVDSNGAGIGLGTYRENYDQIIHNTGLWLVVEMSVVGLIMMLAIVIVPAVAAYRLRRVDSALSSALLGAHIVMVVISLNIEAMYQRQWWLVIGMIAGASALRRSGVHLGERDRVWS